MKRLTGEQLYNFARELFEHPTSRPWDECMQSTRDLHDQVAARINAYFEQDAISAQDMRDLVFAKVEAALDPLNEWKRVCGIEPFDAAKLLTCYIKYLARLPQDYCEESVAIQEDLDKLEEVANRHGLEFSINEPVIGLVVLREDSEHAL